MPSTDANVSFGTIAKSNSRSVAPAHLASTRAANTSSDDSANAPDAILDADPQAAASVCSVSTQVDNTLASSDTNGFDVDMSTAVAVEFPGCSFEFSTDVAQRTLPNFHISVQSAKCSFKIRDSLRTRAMKEKAEALRRQAEERKESAKHRDLIRHLTCAVCGHLASAPVVNMSRCEHLMCARCVVDAVHASDEPRDFISCPAKNCVDYLWDGCKKAPVWKAICEANGAEVQDYPAFNFSKGYLRAVDHEQDDTAA